MGIQTPAFEEMLSTLQKVESTLRKAGSIEFQCYHNERDKALAREFIKMADDAKSAIDEALKEKFFG